MNWFAGELGPRLRAIFNTVSSTTVFDRETENSSVSEICKILLQSDVNVHLVKRIQTALRSALDACPKAGNRRKVLTQTTVKELVSILGAGQRNRKPQVALIVGLYGHGKTTTAVKLASYWKKKLGENDVTVVGTDTVRAGAADQLAQLCLGAGIRFSCETAPPKEGSLVIIDTPGCRGSFDELETLIGKFQPDQILCVVDAAMGQNAVAHVAAFGPKLSGLVVTKLDGAAKAGGALSAAALCGVPILYIGNGEHIEDFEPFDPQRFVGRLLGCVVSPLAATPTTTQSGTAVLNFGEMKQQLTAIRALGPMSSVMAQMGANAIPPPTAETDADNAARTKRYLVIMDSMTRQELASTDSLFRREPARIERLCRGTGLSRAVVMEFLNKYRKSAEVASAIQQHRQQITRSARNARKEARE
jgi:signal recognition particle subunit SRP54